MSMANRYVCGNKKCGRIFNPAPSELVLTYEQLIKNLETQIEKYEKIIQR